MTDKKLPKGYKCPACKQKATFSSWVYSHTHVQIIHTCECGRRNVIDDLKLVGTENPDRKGTWDAVH